ncbi:MAG: hypothetical protein ACJ8CR_25565 [Roseiflexaceae bacterium]
MRKIAFATPLGILLVLTACGQAVSSAAPPPAPTSAALGTPQPTATLQPTEAPIPTQAQAMETPPIVETPPGMGTSVRPPDTLVAAARRRLAQYLAVPVEDLPLQSANQQTWPDGALGCPAPDQIYPQVVTPGFVLVFSDMTQTKTYTVHAGMNEQEMVLCENKQPIALPDDTNGAPQSAAPTPASGAPDPASRPLADLARQDLAQQLGIKAEDITVASVEEVEWRNSSLGCPQPGMNYLQVITPGYRITLEAQGRRYEYHADRSSRVVRCDNPSS